MRMHRAMLVMTILALIKTTVSVPYAYPIERCGDVFESFMPCMDFVEGICRQPSQECCSGVANLNNIVKRTYPGSRTNYNGGNVEETVRVCECIEIMGRAEHPPFLPAAINNLPPLCSLTLSFPISVSMDCSQFRYQRYLNNGN